MAKSMVEKYEQILSADPGSMVFVELAKALIDKGDNGRAIDIVSRGLDHHPDSIVGRVLWGKALLNLGKPAEAMGQFDGAVAIEKDNPYAYNLIGEVLLHKALYRSALPILKKAVMLQPGDTRVRQWLDQAQRALGGQAPVAEERDLTSVDAGVERPPAGPGGEPVGALHAREATFVDLPAVSRTAEPPERAVAGDATAAQGSGAAGLAAAGPDGAGAPDPWLPGATPAQLPLGDSTTVDAHALPAPGAGAGGSTGAAGDGSAAASAGAVSAGLQAAGGAPQDPFAAASSRPAAADPDIMPGLTATFISLSARDPGELRAAGGPAALPAVPAVDPTARTEPLSPYRNPPGPDRPGFDPHARTEPFVAAGADPAATVPARKPPPPLKGKPSALDLLGDIPDAPAAPSARVEGPPPEQQKAAAQQAAVVAAEYEKELRQRLYSEQARPKSFLRRRWLTVSLGVLAIVGALSAGGAYLYVRAQTRDKDIADYTAKARNGLSRDTFAAYRAAVEALDKVLDRDAENVTARALKAQALATLAAVYGTGDADRDDAKELLDSPDVRAAEPEPVLAARWALAGLTPEPSARKAVEDEILAAGPETATPTLHSLAGAVLLGRNQPAQAIDRFNAAIKAGPSHVPTLVRVGDYYRSRGEHEDALRYYGLALAVVEDHPGALLGAAESRLESSKDPKVIRDTLSALAQLGAAETVPVAQRPRLALLQAKLHAAVGERKEALEILAAADAQLKERPDLVTELAEAFLSAGALDKADEALELATRARPEDVGLREQYAKVLLARENFRGVSRLKAGEDDRALHLLKGIAWYRMGEQERARGELKATSSKPEGRLPVDAVVYLSLVDLATGDKEKARANLQRLGTGPRARTSGRWGYAQVLLDDGKIDEAEKVLREAIEADPRHPETRCALGRLLLDKAQLDPAIAELQEAVGLNPFHREALVALGGAQLRRGDPAAARARFTSAVELEPKDGGALAGLAMVLKAEGKLPEAREQATKAIAAAPRSAAAQQTLGEIAAAQGDAAVAARAFRLAVKLSPGNALLICALGEAQLATSDPRSALQTFGEALKHQPGLARARLGMARAMLGTRKPIPAEKELRGLLRGARSDPKETAKIQAYLSDALLSQGKAFAGKAIREAEKAVKADDGLAFAHLALARALELSGDMTGAGPQYQKAAELAPTDPDIRLSRGFFLAANRGDAGPEAAVAELEAYLKLAPRGPSAGSAKKVLAQLRKQK